MRKIQVILGSTRPNRASENVAKWFKTHTDEFRDLDFEFIDLRDYPLPFFNEPIPTSGIKGNYSTEIASKWAKKVAEADGYVFITSEYNHGYTAVLKNAIDYVYYEWNRKPAAFVSYGNIAGGARAVEQLREVVVELQMAPIRDAVHIPIVWEAFDENGNLKNSENFDKSADKLLNELKWWTNALSQAREEAAN